MVNKKKKIRLFLVFVTVVGLWYLYNWSGKLLKPIAVSQIEGLTDAEVQIDSVKFRLSGKVSIYNLRIRPAGKTEPNETILNAQTVDAHFSTPSLLLLRPRLNRLKIEDFLFNAQYNQDKKLWNIAGLKPRTSAKKASPPVLRFKRGTLKLSQVSQKKSADIITCSAGAGTLKVKTQGNTLTFEAVSDYPNKPERNLITGKFIKDQTSKLTIDAQLPGITANFFGSECDIKTFQAKVEIDPNELTFKNARLAIGPDTVISLDGAVRNLKNAPQFFYNLNIDDIFITHDPVPNTFAHGSRIFEKFIPMLQIFFDNFDPQGLLDIDVTLSGKIANLAETKCKGYLTCKDIKMQYARFPYALENLAGRIDVTETSIKMNKISARHGKVDVTMDGYSRGYRETMDCNIVMSSPNMLLDDDLFKAVMPWQKKLWYTFSPAGKVSGDFIVLASPPNIRETRLYADLLDVSTTCQYFPYTISGITGKLKADGNTFVLQNLVSKKDGGEITLNGHISDTNTPLPKYDFKIYARDIKLGPELFNALGKTQRDFFNKFDLGPAKGSAEIDIYSAKNTDMPIDYLAQIDIKADSIKHPQLPEPLTNAIIDANLTPEKIQINSFTADYNQSPTALSGTIWTDLDKIPFGYCLFLKALDIDLSPELVSATNYGPAAKLAEDYKFAGAVNIEAALEKNSRLPCPNSRISIDCLGNTARINKYDLNIRDINGRIEIDNEEIKLTNLAITPILGPQINPAPKITANGNIKLESNSINHARLDVQAQNIELNDSLLPLSGKFSGFYSKAAPTGLLEFHLKPLVFTRTGNNQKSISLNGSAKLKNATLGKNKLATDINLLVDIDTEYEFDKGIRHADILVEAAHLKIKKRPIENLFLPIVYDPNDAAFKTESFTADCLKGKIIGKTIFSLDEQNNFADYNITSTFTDISANAFLSPELPKNTQSQGKINAELNIQGNFKQKGSAIGRLIGQAENIKSQKSDPVDKISSAIHEFSQKKFDFEKITLDSYLKNQQLQISRLDIIGPSVALRGQGNFDIDKKDINIKFNGYSAPGNDDEPGFLGSLTAGIAPAFLKVDMTGSLENPQVTVTPMPIFKESLEIIGTKK